MREYIIILSILLSALAVNAQETDIYPNGYNVFYYANGQISSEGYMENGKPNGYWKNYYPNGNMRSEGKRTLFELDSIWNFYHENGKLSKQITYRMGKKHGYSFQYKLIENEDSVVSKLYAKELYYENKKSGVSEYYYPETGNIRYTSSFKDDKRHGLTKEYSKNGEIINLFEYFNGYLVESNMVNRRNSDKQKTGKWVEFYPAGQIKIEAYYLADLLHGMYREYSKSGKIIREQQYFKGKPVIAEEVEANLEAKLKQSYYPNGNVRYEGAFIDSIPVGLHKEYNANGKINKAMEYNEFGQVESEGSLSEIGEKDSLWVFYYPDKSIRAKGAFKDGKRHGKWDFYFADGSVEQTGNYRNGKAHGLWTWYYSNGKVLRIENYHKGKREGKFVELSIEGDTIQRGEFFDNVKQGEWFYNVGDHTEIGTYDYGLKQGIWRHYLLDDQLIFEGNYIDNEADGMHQWWYDNGKTELRGNYIMGTKNGNWYKYHPDGNIFLIYNYKAGELFKINGKRWDKWEDKLQNAE